MADETLGTSADETASTADVPTDESTVDPIVARYRGWLIAAGVVVALLVASNIALWVTRDSAGSGRASEVEAQVDRVDRRLSSRFDSLQSSLEVVLGEIGGDAGDLASQVEEVYGEVEAIRECVNAYMDVIADWSYNTGSTFEFFYC